MSDRARASGTYPSSSTARWTRSTISPVAGSPFSTRDTEATETPAARATPAIVGRLTQPPVIVLVIVYSADFKTPSEAPSTPDHQSPGLYSGQPPPPAIRDAPSALCYVN
ncbi:hypothetical protein GCM10009554_15420 [Kribbella koreensis]|uniref:Uncharacterized protein n=1 Tax=Kribbella koreensis TaxID=57909 RepID=A0ABP4A4U6_9ACTN